MARLVCKYVHFENNLFTYESFFAFLEELVCITLVRVVDEDMFRRRAATTVIDAMDSRGSGKVVFDAFGKAALACVMRAYGFELISGASACVFWHETYDWIFKTGYASEAAAWTLLVDVLRDRQRPADWQHHPEIVMSRRCSEQGISSEAATLRVAIEHWQEETGNAGLPTTDQHRQLRLRIDKYLRADLQQKRKKALETRYPLDYRHTDPAGDWPGREEDDLEPGAWRSAAERKVMFLCVDGQRLRKQNSNCMFPHWPWWKVVMKVPETHFGLWSAWMHHFNKDCSRLPGRGM